MFQQNMNARLRTFVCDVCRVDVAIPLLRYVITDNPAKIFKRQQVASKIVTLVGHRMFLESFCPNLSHPEPRSFRPGGTSKQGPETCTKGPSEPRCNRPYQSEKLKKKRDTNGRIQSENAYVVHSFFFWTFGKKLKAKRTQNSRKKLKSQA